MVEQLTKERDEWREATEKNAQAAKLFAEKKLLQQKIDEIETESKATKESLTTQMRNLNDLLDASN
jgi:uncharacterized protein YdcH (DUF465 family)